MESQQLESRLNWDNKVKRNSHHLLFFRRKWRKEMWSRRLREHHYMEVKIPADTLHQQIHKIMDQGVPKPNEFACEMVWYDLEDLRKNGIIDTRMDGIEQRLNVLIDLLKCSGEDVDDTVKALLTQKYIARKFYDSSL